MKIGVIGNGFVGKATKILQCDKTQLLVYDINPDLCEPKGTTLKDICKCHLIFISVPTPMNKDGSCYLNIVESVVNDIKKITNLDDTCVVIRSTVPPGTSDRLNCYFMPEFLREKNFIEDFKNNNKWIFGIKNTKQDEYFKRYINQLFTNAFESRKINFNKTDFVLNSEAEMIKMFRNNFLTTKVSFCNEIYEFCSKRNINYEVVRRLGGEDRRIGLSHTMVPGPDGSFGYGGTCFPKDINSMLHEMKKEGMKSFVIQSVVDRNEEVDRSKKDWMSNKGRAVI